MSDKAEAFHDGWTPSAEAEDSFGTENNRPAPSAMAAEGSDPLPGGSTHSIPYGPAPKPVKRPLIFDRVYPPVAKADIGSKSASPSFSISAQRSTSSPVNTTSPESRGEQPSILRPNEPQPNGAFQNGASAPAAAEASGAELSGAEGEARTISVECQSNAPSLNELSEVDISEASRDELMVYHSELMGWIRELERALQDCQGDFKAHLQQYAAQEQLLEQRTQAVSSLQASNSSLNKEVDVQQKAYQRQTILVETLQAQLDSSQERIAQMERDFSQVQRRCSDQAQQLLQAEGLCRDLKSRLSRQQRHTMQFKSALEKSLAVSVNDSDYDLGDVDADAMDSSGELFPRSKPVQPWVNPSDEAALTQALSDLDAPAVSPASEASPGPAKGSQLQLAFESPEDAEFISAQAMASSKAKMAYGNAAMGLAASQQQLGTDDSPFPTGGGSIEPVFDPAQAENLEVSLKQESESILQGAMLAREASAPDRGTANAGSSGYLKLGSHTGPHGVAFVPPIKPVLQEDAKANLSLNSGTVAPDLAASSAERDGELASDARKDASRQDKKRVTSLAGIDLPSFPKP